MKINFSETLPDRRTGDRLLHDEKPLTLKHVAFEALCVVEAGTSGEEKYKRGKLVQRIAESEGAVELSTEEVSLIKKRIGEIYGPIVVVAAHDLLEAGSA